MLLFSPTLPAGSDGKLGGVDNGRRMQGPVVDHFRIVLRADELCPIDVKAHLGIAPR